MSIPLTGISSMATRALLASLTGDYQRLCGQAVAIESVGGVDAAKRVRAGEAFDVVVLASEAIDPLLASGHLRAGSRVDLVKSGVAVAVAAGALVPDITSEAALRQAVLAAPNIGYSTGPSGVQLQRLFARWGIADEIAPRCVQAPPGVPVGSLVARGDVALGFQQLSELLHVDGIQLLGPLPAAVQINTTFSAGVGAHARQPEPAHALLAWLASPATAAAKRSQGMDPA